MSDKKDQVIEAAGGKATLARTAIGGALMGIANIIPGVSGGTMILAVGLYEKFVNSVADFTRFKWSLELFVFLAVFGVGAFVGVGGSVFPIKWGLEHHHHVMYALFIGLTLGGVPLLLRQIRPLRPSSIFGIVAGFAVMVAIPFANPTNLPHNWITFAVAGFIASAAMVLPGISGSYLLLIVGLYAPFTGAIKDFLSALPKGDFATAWQLSVTILVPIGIGVIAGIAGLTNALKALLRRYHHPTIGVLTGLLLGSVVGLYPFGALKEKGEEIAAAHPVTVGNVILVLAAVAIGFAATVAITRLGGDESSAAG